MQKAADERANLVDNKLDEIAATQHQIGDAEARMAMAIYQKFAETAAATKKTEENVKVIKHIFFLADLH